jgi:tetratricopeptide (TPR) repeat protein
MRRAAFYPIAALILCALATHTIQAQGSNDQTLPGSSYEIAGQVRAADGRAPVERALVRLERFAGSIVDQISTDGTGRFRFAQLQPGQYIVTVKLEGFSARSQPMDISRLSPRQYVLLQLVADDKVFNDRADGTAVVDAGVPEDARNEFVRAQAALQEAKADDARRHLEKAVSIFPDFFAAQMLLGSLYMDAKELGKAEHTWRRALSVRPKTVEAYIMLGELYRQQKKYKEAEQALVAGLKLDTGSWRGHFTMGRVYWEMGEVERAAPHVGQALKLKPDNAAAHLLAGNIFVRLNMLENALVEYEEYLRLAPGGEFAKQTQENVNKLRRAIAGKK